jgi:hypothetical protein
MNLLRVLLQVDFPLFFFLKFVLLCELIENIVTCRMVRVTNNYGIRRMVGFITVSCTRTLNYN